MKVILMNDDGGPEVLQYCETSDPVGGSVKIVVDIHAASLNPADWQVRKGYRKNDVQMDFPHILRPDFSDVVREAGPGAGGFSRGDAVFGVLEQVQEGTYAETLAIKAELVAKKPLYSAKIGCHKKLRLLDSYKLHIQTRI